MMGNLVEVSEGRTRLLVPLEEKLSKKNPVFYNPVMELSRDISIAAAKTLKAKEFCDLLAGSGARGVRVANELGCGVLLNDVNPKAVELIKKNIALNSVKREDVEVRNEDANVLLAGRKFDFIDIDPFGSPVFYVDSAVKSMRKDGILAVTATDTSALCGTHPRACLRKYDSLSLRTDYYNELGLRILIGFIARIALRYDYGVRVLFSHCTNHYFRTYVKLARGSEPVKTTQENLSFVQHCFGCLERRYAGLRNLEAECNCCGGKFSNAGPIWSGVFADAGFCAKLGRELSREEKYNTSKEAVRLVSLIREEQNITLPYYDFHKICRKLRKTTPKTEEFAKKLAEKGFKITPKTHFNRVGLRTNAPCNKICECV